MSFNGTALLPTGVRVNPMAPEAFFLRGTETLYVLQRLGSNGFTVASSAGHSDSWAVGTIHEAYHDQEGYQFGLQKVMGIVRPGLPNEGMVPNQKLPSRVFK